MTDSIEDLAERVTALESQVREIRADAAAARVLADAAARDVSEFKQILTGHTRVLNALRETQVEQGDRLIRLEDDVASMKREMREGFSMMNVDMAQVTALLRNIEARATSRTRAR